MRIGSRSAERGEQAAAEIAALPGVTGTVTGGGNAAPPRRPTWSSSPCRGKGTSTVAVAGGRLAGKIVVDCVNPLGFDAQARIALPVPGGQRRAAGRGAAAGVAGVRGVPPRERRAAGRPGGRRVDLDVLVLGDDREAAAVVQALAGRIDGMRGVWAGRLRNAAQVEALTANLIAINKRYKVHAGVRRHRPVTTSIPGRRRSSRYPYDAYAALRDRARRSPGSSRRTVAGPAPRGRQRAAARPPARPHVPARRDPRGDGPRRRTRRAPRAVLAPDPQRHARPRAARPHPAAPAGLDGVHPAPGRARCGRRWSGSPTSWSSAFVARGGGDLIAEVAEPLPVTVIAELLGIPEADRPLLRPWSADICGMYELNPSPEAADTAVRACVEFSDYLRGLAARAPRDDPGDDLITRARARSRGDRSPRTSSSAPACCCSTPATRRPST